MERVARCIGLLWKGGGAGHVREIHRAESLGTVTDRSNQASGNLAMQPRRRGRPRSHIDRAEASASRGGTTDGTDRLECFERTARLAPHAALPRRRNRRDRLRQPVGGRWRRADSDVTSRSPRSGAGRAEDRRHAQARLRHQPDSEPRPGQGQPRHRRRRACLEPLLQPRPIRHRARSGAGSRRELDGQRRRAQLQLHAARRVDLPQRRSAQSRRHRLHLRADDRPRLRIAPREQAGAGRVGRYSGRSDGRVHPERAVRALPRRRRQPRPRPRPDADLATRLRGDGRGAVRPDAGRLRSLRHRRRDTPT